MHDLYDKNLNPNPNPIHLIVVAVGGLNCSSGDVFYVPVLSGTVQGPIESMFKRLQYIYLPLPLRLLWDEEVFEISKFVAEFDNLKDYVNDHTFRRCIDDFGGQVRALELFYYSFNYYQRKFLKKKER